MVLEVDIVSARLLTYEQGEGVGFDVVLGLPG